MDKSSYELITYQPTLLPYNEDAERLTAKTIKAFELKAKGATGNKNRVLVASFLSAAALVKRKKPKDGVSSDTASPVYLGVSRTASTWSRYPLVGKDLSIAFIDRLIEKGWMVKVEGSGDRGFVQNQETGKWTANPTMTMYETNDRLIWQNATGDERYVEVGRPLIKVNQAEARGQREHRKGRKLAKPTLTRKQAKDQFGQDWQQAESRLRKLNEFWKQHPLVLMDGNAAACATRVFHDSRIDAGGRFYGLWTGLDSSLRLKATIDGEKVCQIDIRGSQPTLLSSLLGVKLNGVSEKGTWYDVYTEITGLWDYGLTAEIVNASLEDEGMPDPFLRPRQIAKSIIMEIIGVGNVDKAKPSSLLLEETNITGEEWKDFKVKLVQAIPALKQLEPRYDKNGDVSGYINGAGFLSYHESEMILETIETLHDQGIPAYPVHDCLIVKLSNVEKGVEVLKDTIMNYCYKLNGLKVSVPLTLETSDGTNIQSTINLHPDKLRGEYL